MDARMPPSPNLLDDGVQDFVLEGSEDDGFVFDGIDDETARVLNHSGADVIDRRHRDDETVLATEEVI